MAPPFGNGIATKDNRKKLKHWTWTLRAGQFGDHKFAVLAIEHSGANDLFAGMPSLARQDGADPGTYRNRFTCAPRAMPIRPRYWKAKPVSSGGQVGNPPGN